MSPAGSAHPTGGSVGPSLVRLIAAIDSRRGIADATGIPWQGRLPSDARYFRDRTAEGAILMGYGTYAEFDQPLHGRLNTVLAREGTELRPGFELATDLEAFVAGHRGQPVWIIGGGGVFERSLALADQLLLTQLDQDFHCTVFFPEFADRFTLSSESAPATENGIGFRFQVWDRSERPGDQASTPK